MSDLSERLGKTIGKHFVTLSCVQQPSGGEDHVHVFSGFVVEIAGEWLYITAGHILRAIREATQKGSVFDVWRLGDQTAGYKFQDTAVPYAFDIDQWCVLEDESLGLDYAAVHIGGLYRRQLEAGGVVPFGPDSWSDHTVPHDHWALIGVPSESVTYDGRTIITAKIVVAPLIETGPPLLAEGKAMNQFYAKLALDSDGVATDLDGMSGGPIAMLKYVDNRWKYSIIGVQSSWYRSLRIIAACPIRSFTDALYPVIKEALKLAAGSAGSHSAT